MNFIVDLISTFLKKRVPESSFEIFMKSLDKSWQEFVRELILTFTLKHQTSIPSIVSYSSENYSQYAHSNSTEEIDHLSTKVQIQDIFQPMESLDEHVFFDYFHNGIPVEEPSTFHCNEIWLPDVKMLNFNPYNHSEHVKVGCDKFMNWRTTIQSEGQPLFSHDEIVLPKFKTMSLNSRIHTENPEAEIKSISNLCHAENLNFILQSDYDSIVNNWNPGKRIEIESERSNCSETSLVDNSSDKEEQKIDECTEKEIFQEHLLKSEQLMNQESRTIFGNISEKSSDLPTEASLPNPVDWLGDSFIDIDSDDELFLWFDAEGDSMTPTPIESEKILNESDEESTSTPTPLTTSPNNAEIQEYQANTDCSSFDSELCLIPDSKCIQIELTNSDFQNVIISDMNIDPKSKIKPANLRSQQLPIGLRNLNKKNEIDFVPENIEEPNTNEIVQQNHADFPKFYTTDEISIIPDIGRIPITVQAVCITTDILSSFMEGYNQKEQHKDYLTVIGDKTGIFESEGFLRSLDRLKLKEAPLDERLVRSKESQEGKGNIENLVSESQNELGNVKDEENLVNESINTICEVGDETHKDSENSTNQITSNENDLKTLLSLPTNNCKKDFGSQNILRHVQEWEMQKEKSPNTDFCGKVCHLKNNTSVGTPISDVESFEIAGNQEDSSEFGTLDTSDTIFTLNGRKVFENQLEIHKMLEETLKNTVVPLHLQKYSEAVDPVRNFPIRTESKNHNFEESFRTRATNKFLYSFKKSWNQMSKILKEDERSKLSSNCNAENESDRKVKHFRKKSKSKVFLKTIRAITSAKNEEKKVRFSKNIQTYVYEPDISVFEDFYFKDCVDMKTGYLEDSPESEVENQPEAKWCKAVEMSTDDSKNKSISHDQEAIKDDLEDSKQYATLSWNVSSSTVPFGSPLDCSEMEEMNLLPLICSKNETFQFSESNAEELDELNSHSGKSPSKLTLLKKRVSDFKLKDWAVRKVKSHSKMAFRTLRKL